MDNFVSTSGAISRWIKGVVFVSYSGGMFATHPFLQTKKTSDHPLPPPIFSAMTTATSGRIVWAADKKRPLINPSKP